MSTAESGTHWTEEEPRTRWSEVSGGLGAATAYQRRFDDLAASGVDIHGEAAFIESLLPAWQTEIENEAKVLGYTVSTP